MRAFLEKPLLFSLATIAFFSPTSATPVALPQDIHASPNSPNPQIITGLFGTPSSAARIVVHDTAGQASWSWSVDNGKNISSDLRACMNDVCRTGVGSAVESKWANNGHSIVAILGFAALVINYHPGRATDKEVSFGICLTWNDMENTHTAELLPGNRIALATTSNGLTGNIKIFDAQNSQNAWPLPVQQLDGIPGVHALVWDAPNSVLWAAGNDRSPLAAGSTSILAAYAYISGNFQTQPESRIISPPVQLTTEWGNDTAWWDGSHAMTPIPNERKLLLTTDLDVHVYDIDTQTFEHGESVARRYLPGFVPFGVRTGPDGVSLPRSDIKSVSFLGNGNVLYVQAEWGQTFGVHVGLLGPGQQQENVFNQMLYRSRWFVDNA